MASQWFYADASQQQQGPVDSATLANVYQRGEITSNTLVWREGLPNWVPFSQVAAELGIASSATWFYVDRTNQRQGPVDKMWLNGAYQRGEISNNTLLWREGLVSWIPLIQAASELGLQISPSRSAATPSNLYTPRKSSGRTGCLIAAVVIGVFGIAIVGILAAIAIPAYHDSTVRAKVMEAYMQASGLKAEVADFYLNNEERCPKNGEGGINSPESYSSKVVSAIYVESTHEENCRIRLEMRNLGASELDGAELVLLMDQDYQWTESSNLPDRYLPSLLKQ